MRPFRSALFVAPSFLVLLAGCRAADRPMDLMERPLQLVPELRVGSIDDEATALTFFRQLEVGSDGRIYTLHPQESRIRVHDASGGAAGTIGGPGEGPGEFSSPGVMGWRGDSLWVLDFRTYRFSYFGADGRFLTSRSIPIDLGGSREAPPPRPEGLLPDGTIFGSPPAWSQEVAAGKITERVVLRLDERALPVDTLFRQSLVNTTWAIQDPRSTSGFGSYGRQPFSDTELVQLAPGTTELVRVEQTVPESPEGAHFHVTRVALDGDTLFSREYPYVPRPIDPTLVDSLVRMRGQSMTQLPPNFPGAPTPARAEELARESLYLPAYHPPVSQLVIGRDGSIWLKREALSADSADWLVLSAQGAVVGTVTTPGNLSIQAAEAGRVWGMETDELDVPYLVRYAVVSSEEET
jgi:hypothetical protein